MQMEGTSQQKSMLKKPMEFIDLNDTAIEAIFKRLDDGELVNIAFTCKRLQRITRYFLLKKYPAALKMDSPNSKEVLLYADDNIHRPCPSIETVVRLYPHIEILHLDTYDSWQELIPIAVHLTLLRELDLKIYVMGYNHIFLSEDRIQRMLCIAFDRNLPIQRLKMDMEFGFTVSMLWMIAENLTQLKELELVFRYEACVGEIEDEDSLRFKTVERLTVQCSNRGEELAMPSIAMFAFDELKEFTLTRLRTPQEEAISFIVRHQKLQKLKFIESIDVSVEVFRELENKLPQLMEIVADTNGVSKEVLKHQFGNRWMISEHSEMYDEKLKMTWKFQRIGS